uniref:Putative secreted protein n=1 Tax=Anopheles marajoara TaxID=58244 RepID=A0A2M4CFD6_9DIPT
MAGTPVVVGWPLEAIFLLCCLQNPRTDGVRNRKSSLFSFQTPPTLNRSAVHHKLARIFLSGKEKGVL